jgi:hypothetical protein
MGWRGLHLALFDCGIGEEEEVEVFGGGMGCFVDNFFVAVCLPDETKYLMVLFILQELTLWITYNRLVLSLEGFAYVLSRGWGDGCVDHQSSLFVRNSSVIRK